MVMHQVKAELANAYAQVRRGDAILVCRVRWSSARDDVYVALFGAFARALACVRMPDAWVLTVCVRCECARVPVGVFYDDARSML